MCLWLQGLLNPHTSLAQSSVVKNFGWYFTDFIRLFHCGNLNNDPHSKDILIFGIWIVTLYGTKKYFEDVNKALKIRRLSSIICVGHKCIHIHPYRTKAEGGLPQTQEEKAVCLQR